MSGLSKTLSVVIIGRNEGERLRRCLNSVQAMAGGSASIEVIYVDSQSTDGSIEVARDLGVKVLTLCLESKPTAAKARNLGWRAAQADWILFLDGDTILDPDFSRLALAAAGDSSIAAVWGHRREIFPKANVFHRVLDLDWVYAPGLTEFCGGDALMRREALESTGGFDETLIAGEEPELCARLRELGFSILHVDAPMTQHDLVIQGWKQYWRRASRAGYAYAQMADRTRGRAIELWSGESRSNVWRTGVLGGLLVLSLTFPLMGLPLLFLLCLRSAYRSRWKSSDWASLLLYGAHSHLQQFPIFTGQLSFWCDLSQGRRRELIEYK